MGMCLLLLHRRKAMRRVKRSSGFDFDVIAWHVLDNLVGSI